MRNKLITEKSIKGKILIMFRRATQILIILTIVFALLPKSPYVQADGGSYQFDFSAADPQVNKGPYSPTYERFTPNGLACPTPSGGTGRADDPLEDAIYSISTKSSDKDAVDSLAPANLALGQIVPFEVAINVSGETTPENGTIAFKAGWETVSTNSDDFGYDPTYMVYCAFMDYGDPYTVDPGSDAKIVTFSSSLINTEIQGDFVITGLDDGDQVVIEIWVVLKDELPEGGANGNVQSRLIEAATVTNPPDTISTGNQTVPLNKLQEFESAEADISVIKSDPDTPFVPIVQFDYTMVVNNNSTDVIANGVTLVDTLDQYVKLISAVPDDPNTLGRGCIVDGQDMGGYGGTITCYLLSMVPLEEVTVIVRVEIPLNAPTDSDIETGTCTYGDHETYDLCNAVSVSAITDDSDPDNNSDTEPTDVLPSADLSISKHCPPEYDTDEVDFIISTSNAGPKSAQSCIVRDLLPDKTYFVSYSSNYPSTQILDGTDVVFTLTDALPVDSTWVITLTVDVSETFSTTVTTITNTVFVTKNTPDPSREENLDTDTCESRTPVTLTYFASNLVGDEIKLEWSTNSKTGIFGYNLYRQTGTGLEKINPQIIPFNNIDVFQPSIYQFTTTGSEHTLFYLEEIDLRSRTNLLGPFDVNLIYGQSQQSSMIDWLAIRKEHETKVTQHPNLNPVLNSTMRSNIGLNLSGSTLSPWLWSTGKVFLPINMNYTSRVVPIKPESFSVELLVDRDGIYRITYEDLLASGFDLFGIETKRLELSNRGLLIPIYTSNSEVFGPGSYIEFLGRVVDSPYTHTNVYTLTIDGTIKSRIPLINGAPDINPVPSPAYLETVSIDKNIGYGLAAPHHDPWFEKELRVYLDPQTWSFDIEINELADGIAPSILNVGLWGFTDWPKLDDHHVIISLNDVYLTEIIFDGITYRDITVEIPEGTLHEGVNQLQITLPADTGVDWSGINLDRYSIIYPRHYLAQGDQLSFNSSADNFQISGFSTADIIVYRLDKSLVRLDQVLIEPEGDSYLIKFAGTGNPAKYFIATQAALNKPRSISSTKITPGYITHGPAELLIISHPDFIFDLVQLAKIRTAQGYSVRVVDVEDIYALFSHRIFDPLAIKAFIQFAVENMNTHYVLLIGGDTFDYLDYANLDSMSFIPSLYGPTDIFVKHTPLDSLYADVDGDNQADVAIGRLPVRSSLELDHVLYKTIKYGNIDYSGTALFTADEVDNGLSFADHSEDIISYLPPGWNIDKVYIDDYLQSPELGLSAAREKLFNSINNGVALVNFIGHSSDLEWTFQGFFNNTDVANLTNDDRPTAITQWGCWHTYHVTPAHNTMAHELLSHDEQGAALVLGSATLSPEQLQREFGRFMMPLIMDKNIPIGDALLISKQLLLSEKPYLVDLLNGWMLFGDPTLVVH